MRTRHADPRARYVALLPLVLGLAQLWAGAWLLGALGVLTAGVIARLAGVRLWPRALRLPGRRAPHRIDSLRWPRG